MLLCASLSEFTGYLRDSAFQVGAFICGILFNLPLCYWECPRCGNAFFYKSFSLWSYQPLAIKCRHCGLPKWQEPELKAPSTFPPHYPRPDPKAARRKTQETFLTLVLRDDPGAIGLKLDRNGWVEIDSLLAKAKKYGIDLSTSDLERFLVESCADDFESDRSGALVRFKKTAAARNERG